MAKEKKSKKGLIIAIVCLCIVIGAVANSGSDSKKSEKETVSGKVTTAAEKQETKTEKASESVDDKDSVDETVSEEMEENAQEENATYEINSCYEVVETSTFYDSLGDTIVVHKVLAKKDTTVAATLLAYDSDGNVIEKSSDEIVLTEGEYNYFRYYFEAEISQADIQAQMSEKKASFADGDRDAVEMVQYNLSEDNLYITFKQVSNNLGAFAKFKLLFYKDGQIVNTDDGYFNIYAENLNGKDSTDVAEIWVYGTDFDELEYIFEP